MRRSLLIGMTALVAAVAVLLYWKSRQEHPRELESSKDLELPTERPAEPRRETEPAQAMSRIEEARDPQPEAQAKSLTLLIVEASGDAVAGVEVIVLPRSAIGPDTSLGELEGIATKAGRKFLSDEAGRVVLPVAGTLQLVYARAEGRESAPAYLRGGLDGEKKIEVLPIRSVTMELRTRDGKPVQGYPISWERADQGERSWRSQFHRMVSNESGSCHFDIPIAESELTRARVVIQRDGVCRDARIIEFGHDDWPSTTVDVPIAPYGSLIVDIDGDVHLSDSGSRIDYLATNPDFVWGNRPFLMSQLIHRRARVEFMELGADPMVVCRDASGKVYKAQTQGPSQQGEVISIRIGEATREKTVEIRCRLIDENEKGLSGPSTRTIFTTLNGKGHSSSEQIHCGADGSHEISLPWRDGATIGFVFERRGSRTAPVRVEVASRAYPPGETDLGDLVLEPVPLLVAGRVLDSAGQPIRGAIVGVSESDSGASRDAMVLIGEDENDKEVDTPLAALTGKAGHFAIFARIAADSFEVSARKEGLGSTKVAARRGDKGLELRLNTGATLSLKIRLSGESAMSDLIVKLLRKGGRVQTELSPDEHGLTTLKAPAENYSLVVAARSDEEKALFERSNIVLSPGELLDLGEIAIHLETRRVNLELVGGDLVRLNSASHLIFFDEHGRKLRQQYITNRTKSLTITASSWPIFVEPQAPGIRRIRTKIQANDSKIELKPGIEVKVSLDIDGKTNPFARVRVCLLQEEGDRLIIETEDNADHRKNSGRILVNQPGRYDVAILVSIPTSTGDFEDFVRTGIQPSTLEVSESGGKVEVHCSASEIEDMVKQLARLSSR